MNASIGDVEKAIAQMAGYWKLRRSTFGETLSLPLTSSGLGALDSSDEEVLKSGFFVCLPDDRNNRAVLCYDRSRLDMDFSCDLKSLISRVVRCVFYVLSAMVMSREGVVHVTMIQIYPRNFQPVEAFDGIFQQKPFEIMGAFPLAPTRTEVVCHLPRGRVLTGMEDYVACIMAPICEIVKDGRLTCHGSKRVLLEKLEQSCLDTPSIPVSIGGSWVYFTQFARWRRDRVAIEGLVEVAASGKPKKEMVDAILREHFEKHRRRRIASAYARRKRRTDKNEKAHLHSQVRNLQTEQHCLQKENKGLQLLLACEKAESGIFLTVVNRSHARPIQVQS